MKKIGILILNFGGPRNLAEVRPFLYKLFSDPAILVGIPSPLRKFLAFGIATLRSPSAKKNYAAIGGGSPLWHWTQKLTELVEGFVVDADDVAFQLQIGLRYSSPSIAEALTALEEWRADEVLVFPLFPQFSTTTTGSCLTLVDEFFEKRSWRPKLLKVMRWYATPEYTDLQRQYLNEALQPILRQHESTKVHVLFSAHSLPLKVVARGDPYPQEIEETTARIAEGLSVSHSLAYQSRTGRLPWLEPYVEDAIPELLRQGKEHLIVVPISFVSDHIETLYELDQLYRALALTHGCQTFTRVRTFNDDPAFAHLVKNIILETLR